MLVLENLSFDRGENRGLGALVALLGSQGDKNSGLLTQPRALSTIQPSLEPTWVGGGGGGKGREGRIFWFHTISLRRLDVISHACTQPRVM